MTKIVLLLITFCIAGGASAQDATHWKGLGLGIYIHPKQHCYQNEAGSWLFRCADENTTAAVADRDGDGVADDKDDCPDIKGLKTNAGCPKAEDNDTDGDGILNDVDKCPTVKGTLKGCPDADGDGVADADDLCPSVKGTLKGCPDADGDGVADADDKCPNVSGTLNGCPDSDGDGVADADDKCPNASGTLNGCPDKDNDGVADADDHCPDVAGTIANHGCALSDEERAIIKSASEHIYFSSGSDKIKSSSYADLDKLAAILVKHNEVKSSVEGHTDSQGKDELNLNLSKKRAAAVKAYLVKKGVKADHISSEGFGETKPIASNETSDGRAKNRRVIVQTEMYKQK